MKPVVCLITGPPGVGKSSVAKALVQAFPRAVRIDVDLLRHLVEKGYASPSQKTEEAGKQVRIAAENTCLLAENFVKAGFAVFIDDVVISKQRLDFFFKKLLSGVSRAFIDGFFSFGLRKFIEVARF